MLNKSALVRERQKPEIKKKTKKICVGAENNTFDSSGSGVEKRGCLEKSLGRFLLHRKHITPVALSFDTASIHNINIDLWDKR